MPDRPQHPRPRSAQVVLLVIALDVTATQTIVVSALPALGERLHVPSTSAAWLLTTFMLTSAVVTPLVGRLGDLYGYRRMLVACLACLAVGSVVAALADGGGSYAGVVAGRILQGISGGAIPLAFGIARGAVPAARVRHVVRALSAMFGIGGSLGMVVAGPIVDARGTAWLFWPSLLVAVAAAAGVPLLPADARVLDRPRTDLLGAVALSGLLVCLLLAVSQGQAWGWGSPLTVAAFALAAVLALAFGAIEGRSSAPLIDLRLLRRLAVLTANLATLLIAMAMFAAITVIPRFAQTSPTSGYGFGYTSAQTGLLMIPVAAFMALSSPLSARLSRRTSARAAFQAGAALVASALALFGFAYRQPWEFCLAGAILGVAYGLSFGSLGTVVVEAAPVGQTGAASGVNTVMRLVGAAIGAQLAAVVLEGGTPAGIRVPAELAYSAVFLASAGIALLALLASGSLPRSSRTEHAEAR